MKMTIVSVVIGALRTVTKGLLKGLEDLEIKGQVETTQNYIVENSQNTEKSPGDLRLAVTQTLDKKASAKTDVKNSQGVNNYNLP